MRGASGGFGAELAREESFYIALDEGHNAMLWLGTQLRV